MYLKLFTKFLNINTVLKKKKTFVRTSNSNIKLLYFQNNNIIKEFENDNYENAEEKNKENNKNYFKDNKDNKDKLDNVIYQFRRKRTKSNYIKRYINSNSNSNKNKKKTTDKTKHDIDTDKNKKNNNIKTINQEIVYDTDNEVENNILCLLDKSFKKRNSVLNNNKKRKHYGTQEIFNDKFLRNFHNSIACKNNKTNDFGKISNFSNISIIKKTELNHYDINNIDDSDDLFNEFTKKRGPKFKGMSAQKVVSFEYKDNDDENKNEDFMNHNTRNKRKKKFIIYNNINYFKTTQRDDNELIDKNKNNSINNEEKNDIIICNKKNSFSNNFANRCCSLFNCCFLLE